MTIQNIAAGMPTAVQATGGRFFLAGAAEFADSLRIGEVIKGKVLRQFDSGRYLVNFDGRERVVDSGVPLQTGELIYGRVIAIGERVELSRIYVSESPRETDAGTTPLDATRFLNRTEQILDQLIARYNVRLTESDAHTLSTAVRRAGDGNAMALVGAMLSKLGLKQTPELLWPVYQALLRNPSKNVASDISDPIRTVSAVTLAPAQADVVRQLSEAIHRAIDTDTEADSVERAVASTPIDHQALQPPVAPMNNHLEDRSRGRRDTLAHWLLNAQVDGTVAHRLGTLPLLLGDQLVEVEMSFFEQRQDAQQRPEAKHRKIVFALNLERLGRVEVVARLAGERVSVHVATEHEDKTELVARYGEQLRSLLGNIGWTVDTVSYETQARDYNGAVHAVVEHVVSHDSLNRLI